MLNYSDGPLPAIAQNSRLGIHRYSVNYTLDPFQISTNVIRKHLEEITTTRALTA